MNKLSMQANALRKTANMAANLDDFERVSVPWMRNKLAPMLREAADTIESLSDKLQGVMGTRYCEFFGTPERAANVILALQICPCVKDECVFCPAHDVCFEHYKDGRTVYEMAEWLKGADE